MSANSPVNPLMLESWWSDMWGVWTPRAAASSMWLEQEPCLWPRLAVAPEFEKQVIPASGYVQYNLRLVPGSVGYKFWVASSSDGVQMQITDLALGHQFFQEPVELGSLFTDFSTGRFGSGFVLPQPHPIADNGGGSGMFQVEFWGPVGERVFCILGLGEVAQCPRT